MTYFKDQQVKFVKIENMDKDIFDEEEIPVEHHQDNHIQEYSLNQSIQDHGQNWGFSDRRQQTQAEGEPKKSMNHNFQKHAVITIKKLLRMRYNKDGSSSEKLAHQMWNIFQASGFKSKKMLVILFGKAKLEQEGYRNLLKKCGFQQLLTLDEGLIQMAQQILRERFIEMVREDAVRQNILQCRNIKMKQEFIAYFMELANMLREGPLVKLRLNDSTIKKIKTAIKQEQQK